MCIIHQDFMKENNDTQDRQKIRYRKNPDRSTQKSSPCPIRIERVNARLKRKAPPKTFSFLRFFIDINLRQKISCIYTCSIFLKPIIPIVIINITPITEIQAIYFFSHLYQNANIPVNKKIYKSVSGIPNK